MFTLLLALCFMSSTQTAPAPSDVYAPLWLYQGKWKMLDSGPGKPGSVENQCARIGEFFACQQTVDGKPGPMMVYVPAEKAGHYYTQGVGPHGETFGKAGDLEIAGDRWTFLSKETENSKSTYYRTTNVFSGKNHIHYEQAESPDGVQWKVTGSGDEVRVEAASGK